MRAPTGTASLHQFQGTSEKTTRIPSEGSQLSGMLGQRTLALGLVSCTIQRSGVISQDGLPSLRHFTNDVFTKNDYFKTKNSTLILFVSLFKINL